MTATVEPHLFVIFGATGDLARRKLLPAYYRLINAHGFGPKAQLVGVGRQNLSQEEFRRLIRDALAEAGITSEEAQVWCEDCVHYCPSDEGFERLRAHILEIARSKGVVGNRVFYLAMPPDVFAPVIENLGEAGFADGPGFNRLVVEKPFGRDLASARELNRLVHRYFDESQVYRIDHYLGKETVQNLLVFRFANSLFESLWNRDRVEKVEITVAESVGVEARAGYYDRVGALRDMVQNHLTQVMTLVAMEPPANFVADAVRNEKVKVLRSIRGIDPSDVVYGQYQAGEIDGGPMPGYRDEPGVPSDSATETAVALRVNIDNWRWQGVPFFLRTGKRFPRRLTQIVVTYRRPPVFLFEQVAHACQVHSNRLFITLQPDEGFELLFDVKAPEEPLRLETLPFSFDYREAFGRLPEAYETLILDVLTGDQTLFVRADEVEESWRLYDPLLADKPAPYPYPAGSWGPPEAHEHFARLGASWVVR
jgi:glucose-6-phosphate 1-dehydrogenase